MADLDGIEQMYQEHFLHEKTYGAYTVFQEGVYPTRRDAQNALHEEALYVCEENGAVSGCMIVNGRQPEEYGNVNWPRRVPDEKVGVLHLLMVRPCGQGRGIGSALLNYAQESAKQHFCTVLRLDTGEQNRPAVSLYEKSGFQLAGISSMKVGGVISHNRHLFYEKEL